MKSHTHVFLLLALLSSSIIFFPNCGKHETEGRTIGAVAGAALGTAVAGRHSKGEGAALGALIGGYVGGEYGKAQDDDEQEEKHEKRVNQLRAENRDLKEQLKKYCPSCCKKVQIKGAQSCPKCGDYLIREKFCRRCNTRFNPETGYHYCPYCREKTALRSR